jgi:hypothetical protein
MAYPMYRSAENIPTGTNTTGTWKGFVVNGESSKNVQVKTFNGEGVTFENCVSSTVYPIAFKQVIGAGTTVTDGKLIGLN